MKTKFVIWTSTVSLREDFTLWNKKTALRGFHPSCRLYVSSLQQLFLPVESFRHSVALQGRVGLDPTSDTERIQPHRIWLLHTLSPVSSASSSSRAVFFTNLQKNETKQNKKKKTLVFLPVWKIESFTMQTNWWRVNSYTSSVPLLWCFQCPLTIL